MAMMAIQTMDNDPFTLASSSIPQSPVNESLSDNGFARHRKSSSASSSSSSFQFPAPSSPSKSSASLPLQTPPPVKPNAHPYAIKTTATGLLSRSSSTKASPHYNETHRYVPPPSPARRRSSFTDDGSGGAPPSPTKGSHHYQGSSGDGGTPSTKRGDAYRGHRYSQSLTDVSGSPAPAHGPPPRPLPVPPEFEQGQQRSMSASPSKFSNGEVEGGTPKGYTKTVRVKRPETLPADFGASSTPFVFPPATQADEPVGGDPKSWTPDQVAAYVRQTANSEELANVVLEKQIAGRAFLRIASLGSDERDDIDQALRAASRTLRQSSLRGRIWGLNGTSNEHYRPRSDSESSNSSLDSSFSSNSAKTNGRIRGMIESLERTSSMSTEEDYTRSRSVSPTKPKFSFPPKPKVQDLFSPPQDLDVVVAEPDDEVHATVKAHGQPHQIKELPRLLPLPPTFTGNSSNNGNFGMLSPMSTGTTAVAPNYTGGSLVSHFTGNSVISNFTGSSGNGEFGFMMRPSPSLSPAIQRSERASSRMLPLPPTGPFPMQQPSPPVSASSSSGGGVLHQPIPRRNVGAQGVGVVDKLGRRAGGEESEEEMTMEELLKQGGEHSGPSLGVKAWEMDVGETVKKVPLAAPPQHRISPPVVHVDAAEPSPPPPSQTSVTDEPDAQEDASPRPPATDMSFANSRPTRRVRGVRPKPRRSLDGVKSGGGSASASGSEGEVSLAPPDSKASWRSGRRSKRDSGKQGVSSVMSLFDPPPAQEKGEEDSQKTGVDDEREKAVEERKRAVGLREVEVGKREVEVGKREAEVGKREMGVGARERDLEARASLVEARERSVEEVEARLRDRARELDQREKNLEQAASAAGQALVASPTKDSGTAQQQQREEEEEDTFTLASRLFRRIVAPVFGERFTGTPTASQSHSTTSQTSVEGTQDEDEASSARNARRRGSLWLTMGNRDAGYLMLLGIGVCAIVLRVFLKRAVPGVGLVRGGVKGVGMRR